MRLDEVHKWVEDIKKQLPKDGIWYQTTGSNVFSTHWAMKTPGKLSLKTSRRFPFTLWGNWTYWPVRLLATVLKLWNRNYYWVAMVGGGYKIGYCLPLQYSPSRGIYPPGE